ncbi:hypothetical protein CORC01_00693 [Colletotrichum orchidophilum]|uniref:Uncharacterized protein n=1 Tax=Colletotrichum orchidophilum TaxID=1209926 RepID=A0A1G4BQW7_9PEZI|nr:uncharacterized protein CORC01_00693 [Colletotrichum orchidophilum]OHF03831.1 hypothetical protein CORC01_00693 [Colletotrichum orchidophilum]
MGLWKRHPKRELEPWDGLVDGMLNQALEAGHEAIGIWRCNKLRPSRRPYLMALLRKVRRPRGGQSANWV